MSRRVSDCERAYDESGVECLCGGAEHSVRNEDGGDCKECPAVGCPADHTDAGRPPFAVVTGGGTAGHINPALSIARILKGMGYEVLYIGSGAEDCLDRELVSRTEFDFMGLRIVTPLLRPSFQTLRSIFSILREKRRCRALLKRRKPDIVVGTGGFVSLPVLLAATGLRRKLGIGIALHEQNVTPGFTNRYLSSKVDRVFLTFAESGRFFGEHAAQKIVVTGIPLVHRPAPVPMEIYEERIRRRIRVFVLGGSLGSIFLNRIVVEMDEKKLLRHDRIKITLSCGQSHYEGLKQYQSERLHIVPFLTEMTKVLAEADLLICRAGSSTVFEGIVSAVPAIVIPSPNVAGDHQRPNARFWADTGAAIYAEEGEFTAEKLAEMLEALAEDPSALVKMKRAALDCDMPDASEVLERELRSLIS